MRKLLIAGLLVFGLAMISQNMQAQGAATDGPKYTEAGALMRPADYREWIYLTSGLGMTYGPGQTGEGRPQNFDNVFVNRESFKRFMATGKWPEKTIFVLEIRRAEANVSINNGGRTQGDVMVMEVAVKDSARFPKTTWGYFDMGRGESAMPLPESAACYSCHRDNTAVEWSFVQFYPTLFEVAKRMGTVKPTYDPNKKP